MIDRLPPQSLEAEQSVLGAILIDRDAIVEVAEFLRPEDFYRQANATIYRAVLDLFERREPIDIVTVAETLERTGDLEPIGGRAYLSSLSNQTPTAVHAVQYARIVERKAVLRNLIAAAGKIAGIGYEDPAEIQEAIDRAEGELFQVSNRRVSVGFSSNLVERAADVALKERRRLVLVPREAPLSEIHLENLLRLARLGAVVLPAAPGFYHRPETVQDLLDHVVGQVLDALSVEHALTARWKGTGAAAEDAGLERPRGDP